MGSLSSKRPGRQASCGDEMTACATRARAPQQPESQLLETPRLFRQMAANFHGFYF